VTADAMSLVARLRRAGATLTCSPDGRVCFSAPAPIDASLLAEARHHREAIARVLAAPADLGELPSGRCSVCGGGSYWRLSVLSGGPGPWRCMRCVPPDAADWVDGCAVPIAVPARDGKRDNGERNQGGAKFPCMQPVTGGEHPVM
jgi:hypothetical protein